MIINSITSSRIKTVLFAFLILMTQSDNLVAQEPVFFIDLRVIDSDVNKKLEDAKVTILEDGKKKRNLLFRYKRTSIYV